MKTANAQTTSLPYEQEFEATWSELYDPENGACPVWMAIRKTAWRSRPNYVDLVEFEKALIGRMYSKLRANFINKRKEGMTLEEWRTSVGKLSTTAKSAALEEARQIVEGSRSNAKPKVYQLADWRADLGPQCDTVADEEVLLEVPSGEGPVEPALGPETSHAPSEVVSRFLERISPCDEQASYLEHFRVCDRCLALLQSIKYLLLKTFISGETVEISPTLVAVVDALEVREDIVDVNLIMKRWIDWELTYFRSLPPGFQVVLYELVQRLATARSVVVHNLKSLGYSELDSIRGNSLRVPQLRKQKLDEVAFFVVAPLLHHCLKIRFRRYGEDPRAIDLPFSRSYHFRQWPLHPNPSGRSSRITA
jgi:hypothetical protein